MEDRITPTTFTPTTFLDDGTANSLRGAITQANNDAGTATDTIQLTAGTYTLSIANTAGHENANTQGDLNITNTSHALIIQGTTDANGNPTSIIDQTAVDRVLQIVNPGTTVTFKDLIIKGGQAQDDGTAGTTPGTTEANGGGILDAGGNITLSNVVLQNNSADAGTDLEANGGGIYAGSGGSLTIQSSTIQADGAFGGVGGTSFANGAGGNAEGAGVYANGQTSITNSTLSDNILTAGNGSISDSNGGDADGGGIYSSGPTTITDSILAGNTVTGGSGEGFGGGNAKGGGVFIELNSINITGSALSGNTLTGGSSISGPGGGSFGGGLYSSVTDSSVASTITDSTLSGNTLKGGNGDFNSKSVLASSFGEVGGDAEGGGAFAENGTLTITGSALSSNILTGGNGSLDSGTTGLNEVGGEALGGGIFTIDTTTIRTSILSGNTLTGGNGDYVSGTVSGNIGGSARGGGGYFIPPSVTPTIVLTASTVSGNTITGGSGSAFGGSATPGLAQGGGAYFLGGGDTLVDSTIASNQAIGGLGVPTNPVAAGGGLFFASTATATLTNDTVAENSSTLPPSLGATNGGGIDNDGGTVTLVNTLVAQNFATDGPDYFGAVSNSDHNLIGKADSSTGFSTAHGDLLGSIANPLNPQLGTLANNGGPTQTLALLPGSPAINAGDNNAQSVTGPFDQRGQGFTRVFGGTIDIGAFEIQPPPPPPPGGSGTGSTPPALHVPPLLGFINSLLGGVETVNGNGTETITDRFFGITLFVSTYDSSGNLSSVTIFGINVTFFFELPI